MNAMARYCAWLEAATSESIGTWHGWEKLLSEKGLTLRGHRLITAATA